MSLQVAFSTCGAVPSLSRDDLLAIAPLRERGIEVVPWLWQAPAPPPGVNAVVHRSCWDYHEKTAAFRAWLDALAASGLPSFNSPALTAWNLVLMELEAIDPELFLALDPAAPQRFADSIARALAPAQGLRAFSPASARSTSW